MANAGLTFTDALAQAIAENRKTVTRRPIAKWSSARVLFFNAHVDGGGFDDLDWDAHLIPTRGRPDPVGATPCTGRCDGREYCSIHIDGDPRRGGGYLHVPGVGGDTAQRVYCRWSPGDTLIVRECWQCVPTSLVEPANVKSGKNCTVLYRARDGEPGDDWEGWKWRPSIHMPTWAARSRRRIVNIAPELVGVEPLSQAEAEAEGFTSPLEFARVWCSIYGDRPRWAWRIEFEDGER